MNKPRHTLSRNALRGLESLEDRRTMAADSMELSFSIAHAQVAGFASAAQTVVTTASTPAATTTTTSADIAPLASTVGGVFNVTDYGVIAGRGTVQTAAIQRVFDLASRSGSGATVRFAPGVYITHQINVPDNIGKILGAGAVLKLAPLAGEWARILNVAGTTPGDRPLMTIDGLEFDLNKNQQGWEGGHDLEHQAAIMLAGRKGASSTDYTRLNVAIKNVYMHDGAGDGIYVYHNVTATITDVRAKDIFRGALGITGDGANVTATRFKTSGSVLATGLDVEPNNAGDTVTVKIVDSELMGKFDVALTPGSTFTGTNIKASGFYYLYNGGGKFRLDNSTLYVNDEYRIRMGGDTAITNTNIVLTRNGLKTSDPVTIKGISLSWSREGYVNTNQLVVLDNVKFQTDATIRSTDTAVAIATDRDHSGRGNWLVVKRSNVDGHFDQGISFYGGNLRVENTFINSKIAYLPYWSPGFYYNVVLTGNLLGSRVTTYWSTSYDEPNNKVTHSSTSLTSAQNQFISSKYMYRLGANRYVGSRTITGNYDPTLVRTPGFVGDTFVKSATERWVAIRGDYAAATWVRQYGLQFQIRL